MLYAKDFREAAKQKMETCWWPSIGMLLVYGILDSAAAASLIGLILLTPVLWYGFHTYWLERVRWQRPDLGTLFRGFTFQFGNSIAVYLLETLFTVLWGLLFVIPGIIKSYSYALTPYILTDYPTLDALEVIDLSRDMMNGNKWRLFCLNLSFIGWIILCILTFGIASLYVTPYYNCARAQFYEAVKTEYELEHPVIE